MNAQELGGLRKRDQLRSVIESKRLADLMSTDFEYVLPDEQISDVIKKMGQLDLHEIPVSPDGKKLIGVVSYGTLLRRRNISTTTKAESIAVMPQMISPESSVTTVAEAFLSSGYRQLPVMKGGLLQGTVTRADLIKILLDIKELKDLKVSDIMTADVRTVKLDDPIEMAIMDMKNLDIRTLPVVDKEGRLSGIVGAKEVAAYNWREKHRETVGEIVGNNTQVKVSVDSITITSVETISPDADLGKAIKLMLDRRISTLPVIDHDQIVGILTKYDMIELLASFRQRDMVYMQITGLEQDDRFSMDQMEKEIQGSLQKIAKISRPMLFTIHVTKYNQNGNTFKYSLSGRLTTEEKVWVAGAVDWDLIKSTVSLMQHFERMVIERKEERIDLRRKSKQIGHSF